MQIFPSKDKHFLGADISKNYPIGAYFISSISINPQTILGSGIWELVSTTFTSDPVVIGKG